MCSVNWCKAYSLNLKSPQWLHFNHKLRKFWTIPQTSCHVKYSVEIINHSKPAYSKDIIKAQKITWFRLTTKNFIHYRRIIHLFSRAFVYVWDQLSWQRQRGWKKMDISWVTEKDSFYSNFVFQIFIIFSLLFNFHTSMHISIDS